MNWGPSSPTATCWSAEGAATQIAYSAGKAAVVDPGFEAQVVLDVVREEKLELEWIVNTHGHLDHVAGNKLFKEATGAPIVLHPEDEPFLSSVARQGMMFGVEAEDSPPSDVAFVEGEPFVLDGVAFDVLHTPGHSPGSVSLVLDGHAIVGDTLFAGSIGRTDLPGAVHDDLIEAIRTKLFALPGETICYPGHGPATTVARERATNPFVSDRAVQESTWNR